MHPLKHLSKTLAALASADHYLFTRSDVSALLPELSVGALKALLSRAVKDGLLSRVCRGVYLYERADFPRGQILFHTAARLRADTFSYLSLETVLSDTGAISQMPMQWITLMSAGRSAVIRCGGWGTIEFVHTCKTPELVTDQLHYDSRCHLWRASLALAMQDMRATRRSLDLVDWSVVNESV